MASWARGISAITLFVPELAAAKAFYADPAGHIWELAEPISAP